MICRLAMSVVLGWASWSLAQAPPQSGQPDSNRAPSITVGPVRITPNNASIHRAIVFGREIRRVNTTTLLLNVAGVDPNGVVPFLTDFKIDALTDQSGHPLKAGLRQGYDLSLRNNQTAVGIEISDVPADATDTGKLAFSFSAVVAKSESIEIDDLRPDHTTTHQSPSGDTVSLTFKQTPDGFTVEMLAELKSPDPKALNQMTHAFNAANLRVLDASGKAFNSNGGSTSGNQGHVQRSNKYRIGQNTQNVSLGPPAKIVFSMPVSLTSTPLSGEFKNLALP